jgi:hypothetical protein
MPARDNDTRFAEFIRIIDGDTFEARIHLVPKVRPRVQIVSSIRVQGWSTAELNTGEGRYMRGKFEELLMNTKRIDLQIRGMSFERIVCAVWLDDELFAGILTHELLSLRSARAEHPGASIGYPAAARSADESTASGVDAIDQRDGQEGRRADR